MGLRPAHSRFSTIHRFQPTRVSSSIVQSVFHVESLRGGLLSITLVLAAGYGVTLRPNVAAAHRPTPRTIGVVSSTSNGSLNNPSANVPPVPDFMPSVVYTSANVPP